VRVWVVVIEGVSVTDDVIVAVRDGVDVCVRGAVALCVCVRVLEELLVILAVGVIV
jgi:hypothetical protein